MSGRPVKASCAGEAGRVMSHLCPRSGQRLMARLAKECTAAGGNLLRSTAFAHVTQSPVVRLLPFQIIYSALGGAPTPAEAASSSEPSGKVTAPPLARYSSPRAR